MFYRDVQGRVVGVLNAFDLSLLNHLPQDLRAERTGTIPFMAIELMRAIARKEPSVHLYGTTKLYCATKESNLTSDDCRI